MAKGGRRPKPPKLRLVDGSFRADRHGPRDEAKKAAEQSRKAFGKLERPKYLKGHALLAWKEFIEPATWLDGSRVPAAVGFCELWGEFRSAPRTFQSARHAQMRAYMADLGLTDERQRVVPDEPERDEFFDD